MGLFSKKEYDDKELRNKISDLQLEIEKLKTHVTSIRGLINRKLGNVQGEEAQEPDPYNGVLVKTK